MLVPHNLLQVISAFLLVTLLVLHTLITHITHITLMPLVSLFPLLFLFSISSTLIPDMQLNVDAIVFLYNDYSL
ncbi:hypothetical protein DFH11DRAFT_1628986 [Phellopilus nigrolimitatus]|nr:hypothetical protein DFH11DRAFT_1628986 [Phellopilus nigrolimitatus]